MGQIFLRNYKVGCLLHKYTAVKIKIAAKILYNAKCSFKKSIAIIAANYGCR